MTAQAEPDNSGTVIVTGGSTGLGYQTARTLAAQGAGWHVVIASRNATTGQAAASRIIAETGHAGVSFLPLDLASLASVRRFAAALPDHKLPPLRAIVCNAGLQVVSGTTYTEDGFETTFGVNHLGHFLLVNLLLQQLRQPARIVFVSSDTHDPAIRSGMPAPRFLDPRALAWPDRYPDPADATLTPGALGRRRYTTSKLCNLLCAYELSRRLQAEGRSTPESPITVNAYNPGLMPGTGLARDHGASSRFIWRRLLPILTHIMPSLQTVDEAGRNLARLVLDPRLATATGRYFDGARCC